MVMGVASSPLSALKYESGGVSGRTKGFVRRGITGVRDRDLDRRTSTNCYCFKLDFKVSILIPLCGGEKVIYVNIFLYPSEEVFYPPSDRPEK